MDTLEDCMTRLSTAMQKFTVRIWTNDAQEFGLLKQWFLQFANDLRGSALKSKIYVRLPKMANKADDTHKKVEDIHKKMEDIDSKVEDIENKVDDIHKYLVRSKRSATPSDTVARQEIPLKPEFFYGRDDFVEEITLLFFQEETSRVCILGPGGFFVE